MSVLQKKVFRQFALSYILVACIPLFTIWGLFLQAFHIIDQYTQQIAMDQNEKISIHLDREFENFYRTARQIELFVQSGSILETPNPYQNTASVNRLHTIQQNLSTYILSSNLISDVYLYNSGTGITISSSSIYLSEEQFYHPKSFKMEGMDFSEFQKNFLVRSGRQLFYNQPLQVNELHTDSLLGVFPVPGVKYGDSYLIFVIPNKAIQSVAGTRSDFDTSVILGPDGTRVFPKSLPDETASILSNIDFTDISGPFFENGENYALSIMKGGALNYFYCYISPVNKISQTAYSLFVFTSVLFIFSAVAIAVLSFYFSQRHYKPISSIFRTLHIDLVPGRKRERRDNVYAILNNSVSHIVTDKELLQAENNRQQSLNLKFLFYDLIHGNVMYGDQVELQLKKLGYSANYSVYRCVVCCFLHDGEVLSQGLSRQEEIQSIINETIPGIVESFELNLYSFLLILGLETTKTEELEQLLQQANARIRKESDTDMILAVGTPCKELSKLNLSFNEATLLCQYAKISDKPAVCIPKIAELSSPVSAVSEPDGDRSSLIKITTLLISAVMEGRTIETAEILDKYLDQLLYQYHPPVKELRYIVFTLCNCVAKICDKFQMNTPNIVSHSEMLPLSFATIEEFVEVYQRLKENFQEISRYIIQNQKVSSANLGKQLLEYVDANFTDVSLCLSSVSTEFGICESYVSMLFKKTANVTFSNYIEEKRVKAACQILQNGQASINDLAVQIGYHSPHAFRRAFKKIMNVSPSDFSNQSMREEPLVRPTGGAKKGP